MPAFLKFLCWFSLGLGAAPLLLWPVVAMASLMGLAGHVPPGTPRMDLMIPYAFYMATLLYPVAYVIAFAVFLPSYLVFAKEKTVTLKWRCIVFASAIFPLFYLLCTVLLGYLFFYISA